MVGSDQLLEGRHGVADLLDLRCRRDELVFAVVASGGTPDRRLRVATRHPEAARRYFAAAGLQPELVELDEPALAPGLGLAAGVVELRSRLRRGRRGSRRALEEREVVAACSARLVAGRSARVLRRDEVNALADALRAVVEER